MPALQSVGSRAQVYHGTALHTSGGLTQKDLIQKKNGSIVSARASRAAKNNKNLGASQIPKGVHEFIPGGYTA